MTSSCARSRNFVRTTIYAVRRPVVTGPITYIGHSELRRDIDNLKSGLAEVPGAVGFLPVVAPASAIPNAKNEHYQNEEAYLFGLAEALRTEYRTIIDAGPRSASRRCRASDHV
jgi:5-methyltetrahydropteroyltriglutamate--homocysteine methyltransferase